MDPSVKSLALSYDPSNSKASAVELAYAARPGWRTTGASVDTVYFTEGLTNVLIRLIYRPQPLDTDDQASASTDATDDAEDSLMLRVYGHGTDQLIDRERELRAHATLAKRDLAPKLVARFKNGILYEYVPGVACTYQQLTDPRVYRPVARLLARWHSLVPASDLANPAGKVTDIWDVMYRWMKMLEGVDEEEAKLESPPIRKNETETNSDLGAELEKLQVKFVNTGLPYVFAHCDLLSGNVIISEKLSPLTATKTADGEAVDTDCVSDTREAKVTFIDYEYAAGAPAAFDIANHFAEWGGFVCDVSLRPDEKQIRDFLHSYVVERANCLATATSSSTASIKDQQVKKETDELVGQVQALIAVPAFFWGLWARVQSRKSKIEFDYGSYSRVRLDEYWDWKKGSE